MARTIRAMSMLARDGRIPRPLRGLLVLGLLPIPGPFDEALLLILAGPMFLFYRPVIRDAWAQAGSHRAGDRIPAS